MAAMTYNRSEIMKEAWADPASRHSRRMFARSLCQAWFSAKRRIELALQSEGDRLRERISMIENKSRLTREDYAQIDALRAELSKAVDHDKADEFAAKRNIIKNADTCTVTFVKADGTPRTMHVRVCEVRRHVKRDRATDAGRKASNTRAFRHAHLMPVWDAEARAIKSVNLSTVTRIETATETHTF